MKSNMIVHNLSEVFIYGGLAAIFVPIMNVFAAILLLLLIAVYDFIAVFKIKHMVTMAKFQTEEKLFAGLAIPYKRQKKDKKIKKKTVTKIKKEAIRTAILGGGDIGFPLLFAGVALKDLIISNNIMIAFLKTLIIPIATSLALLFLLVKSEKNKFYPAMPILSAGCFIGYGIIWIINLF